MPPVLPFNTALIHDRFTPLFPPENPDTSPGYRAVLCGTSLLVPLDTGSEQLPQDDMPDGLAPLTEPLMIGLWDGRPLRVFRVAPETEAPEGFELLPYMGPDMRLDNVRATVAGRAAQILHWERRSRYCSHCGGTLDRIQGSWGKKCPVCGDEHFPHIHPCIIVLVRRGDEILLIRNVAWNTGRFSLVAGFLDFGENLEECVRREVFEETGIEVTNVRYVASQNWPFPSQLMVGFLADYAGGTVTPDGAEVVEAHWFGRDNPPKSPGGKRSIARWILDTFGSDITG